jgi:hypothetical protein
MGLKAKILQFFQGLRKKPSRPRKFQDGVDSQIFPKDPTGKRPKGFFMPEWAKKDSYETKDMGQMVPPEELADEASLKAPGDWLRKQLTGKDDAKQFEELKKSKRSTQREPAMSDQEIEDFLGDFISKAQKRRRRRKKPRKP